MKIKRLTAIMLCLMLLLPLLLPALPILAASEPSDWAASEIDDANTTGLLTASAAREFYDDLTRDEFCEIVVNMVELVLGKTLPIPPHNPFYDCNSVYVLQAWQYGIIKGVSSTEFDPDSFVERQQLCVMMIRAIRLLERDLGRTLLSPGARELDYDDADEIADYAIDSVKLASTNGIMIGDDDNYFNPEDSMQSQECVVVVIRSFNRIERSISNGLTTSQLLDLAEKRVNIGYAYGETANGVSQNLTLPTSSTSGSTVTWTSSNNSIINASGVVTAGRTAQTATLTATIRLGGQTRTKTFTVRTSQYTGEQLHIENAYAALNIVYINAGDSASSVSGRIGLPTKVLDLPVTWTSARPTIISDTGIVNAPSGSETSAVTLTAVISNDYTTRVKTFSLSVINPAFGRGVSLHRVQFGMSQTQVTQVLGTPVRAIQAGVNEVWRIFHSSYSNFIAVAFSDDIVTAVYSMASGVSSQLRNNTGSVISVSAANAIGGVAAVSYTDGSQQYAIMIYDRSSAIGTARSLYAEGEEQMLLELVNAFRVRNARTVVQWSDRLGKPSRDHSEEMGQYNFLSTTSRNGRSLQQRAVDEGFDRSRYTSGNVLAGEDDAIAFFHKMVGTSTMRTNIVASGVTSFGSGFSGGNSGTYRNYVTYMFGSLSEIQSITATQDLQGGTSPWPSGGSNIIAVSPGGTATVTLTVSPTGYNETFTVASSNQYIMTVTRASTTTLYVYGVSSGDADIVITCNSSGLVFNIPVIVDTIYSSGLTLSYSSTVLTNAFFNDTSQIELMMGTNSNITISAATGLSGTVVRWASSDTSIGSVSQSGVVTSGSSTGSFIVTATVDTSPYTTLSHSVRVNVITVPTVTIDVKLLDSSGRQSAKETTARIVYNNDIAGADVKSWSSGNTNAVRVGAPLPYYIEGTTTLIGSAAMVTAVNAGKTDLTTSVRFTASWTNGDKRGTVTGSVDVTALAVDDAVQPKTLTIYDKTDEDKKNIGDSITCSIIIDGSSINLGVLVDPVTAANKNVTWSYVGDAGTYVRLLPVLSDESEVRVEFITAGTATIRATSVAVSNLFIDLKIIVEP